MPLTVLVTRDVEARYRGYLGSLMLEVAPGVYVSPRLNRDTRERVWETLTGWHRTLQRGSVVMVWRQADAPSATGLALLGEAPKDLVEIDGLLLTRRPLSG